jgi:predicted MFS family arabinose efflux permease
MTPGAPPRSERVVLLLVTAVQFVNILDFMMVMPLGPDFATDQGLGIALPDLGLIAGSYTAAAAVAGVVGSFFLDRFDRRSALAVAMLGLVTATALGGFAGSLEGMVLARVIAGCFGGPATALSLSIVADVVPIERRGRAMGTVMGSFAVASVLGVPAGLELARLGGWRAPFFGVAALGLLVALGAIWRMPPLRAHLSAPRPAGPAVPLGGRMVLHVLAGTAVSVSAGFILFPSLAAWIQYNANFPREYLGFLYMLGGTLSFFSMRVVGRMVDRFGGTRVAAGATVLFAADLIAAFTLSAPLLSVPVIFTLMMLSNSGRNVALSAVSTRVPLPAQRARFLSAQSAVQHAFAAASAILSSWLLTEMPDHRLEGMNVVAWVSIACASILPLLLWSVERELRRRAPEAALPRG